MTELADEADEAPDEETDEERLILPELFVFDDIGAEERSFSDGCQLLRLNLEVGGLTDMWDFVICFIESDGNGGW